MVVVVTSNPFAASNTGMRPLAGLELGDRLDRGRFGLDAGVGPLAGLELGDRLDRGRFGLDAGVGPLTGLELGDRFDRGGFGLDAGVGPLTGLELGHRFDDFDRCALVRPVAGCNLSLGRGGLEVEAESKDLEDLGHWGSLSLGTA